MHNDFDNWENVFVSRRLLSQRNISLGTNLQNALLTVRPAFNYCAIANCIAPWYLFYASNQLIDSIWNLQRDSNIPKQLVLDMQRIMPHVDKLATVNTRGEKNSSLGDIVCEQSLFSSNIRREERKTI